MSRRIFVLISSAAAAGAVAVPNFFVASQAFLG